MRYIFWAFFHFHALTHAMCELNFMLPSSPCTCDTNRGTATGIASLQAASSRKGGRVHVWEQQRSRFLALVGARSFLAQLGSGAAGELETSLQASTHWSTCCAPTLPAPQSRQNPCLRRWGPTACGYALWSLSWTSAPAERVSTLARVPPAAQWPAAQWPAAQPQVRKKGACSLGSCRQRQQWQRR